MTSSKKNQALQLWMYAACSLPLVGGQNPAKKKGRIIYPYIYTVLYTSQVFLLMDKVTKSSTNGKDL